MAFSTILICFASSLYSQYFETGQDPSSIKWRQINTKYFKLVYDSVYENQAQHLAAIFEYCDTLSGKSLSQKPEKISILVHNHSALSNGLVVWAPKRMEIYPVSPQDIYAQNWFDQLGLHEWRHVAQISRTRRGFTSFANILFGQQAQGLAILFMHDWFLEGDAVTTETALCNTGRGREPSFEMETRTFLMETHKPFLFKKEVMGSFRDHIPDIYQLGYLMVAYNRAKYGTKLWENVLDYDGKYSFSLFPFYFSLKKSTGLSRTKLYEKTFYELDSAWICKSKEIQYSDVVIINKRTNDVYTSYRNPCYYNDTTIIAEKSGIDDVTKFVKINIRNGKENVIFISGLISSDNLSIGGKYMVWAEIINDVRWENRSFSVIRRLDIETGKSKYLTKKSKYYAPVISPNARTIATVETNVRGENSIVLLSADNGKKFNKFRSPGNCSIQLPSWDDSSRYLAMTAVNDSGKGILILDTKSGSWQTILSPSSINKSQPRFFGNYILYRSGLSGIENLYAVSRNGHKIFQVSSVRYGAFDPVFSTNRQSIIFSNYTSHGFDLASLKIDTLTWIPLENVKNISLKLADKISAQEPEKYDPDKIQNKKYISKPYSKFANLIYIHSWMPLYTDTKILSNTYGTVMPGYMLLSQNLQGSLIAYGGQGFYNNKIYSNFVISYEAVFPVFEVTASDINKVTYIGYNGNATTINGLNFSAGGYLPIDLSRGNYAQTIIPEAEFQYEKYLYVDTVTGQMKSNLYRFAYSLNVNRFYQTSQKDLFSKFGESILIYFSYPPKSQSDVTGKYWYVNSDFYFPGIFRHNGLKLSFAYEKQEVRQLRISSSLPPPRGFYNVWNLDTNKYSRLTSVAIDYAFPLIYPDIQILKIIFLKRISGDLYVENANGKLFNFNNNSSGINDFTSTGLELTGDYNLFYIPVLINMGVRLAYRPKFNQWVSEFIWRINLNSF